MHLMERKIFSNIIRLIFLGYAISFLPLVWSLGAEFPDGVTIMLKKDPSHQQSDSSATHTTENRSRSLRVKVKRLHSLPPENDASGASDHSSSAFYVSFPDEGPEAALLADFLSKMAIRTLFEPLFRPAMPSEISDILTFSMYCTALIMGSFVFGIGFLILSWRVHLSIKAESVQEPISISFFLTIPGLRYLYNHYRHHLWGYPLMPRRRFASFMVGGSSHASAEDLMLNDVKIPKRRDSVLRNEIPLTVGPNRRKSIAKSGGRKAKDYLEVEKPTVKRHSVAVLTPPPSSKESSRMPTPPPVIPITSIHEEVHSIQEDIESDVPLLSPTPQTSSVIFTEVIEVFPDSKDDDFMTDNSSSLSSTINEITEDASTEYTSEHDHNHLERSVSPVSAYSTETINSTTASAISSNEELEKKRTEWVRNMPLFSRDASPVSYDSSQVTSPFPIKESKLSRRLKEGKNKNNSPEESKLSRYFKGFKDVQASPIQSSFGRSSNGMALVEAQLEEGTDLTPPPGFNRRHSSFFPQHSSTNHLEDDEEGDDMIDPQFSFRLRTNMAARRQSFMPSQSDWKWFVDDASMSNEQISLPFNSPQSTVSVPTSSLSMSHQLTDDSIPSRPQSTGLRSGRNSVQHSFSNDLSQASVPSTERSPSISLGIFDDIFPPQKDRRSPSLYFQ